MFPKSRIVLLILCLGLLIIGTISANFLIVNKAQDSTENAATSVIDTSDWLQYENSDLGLSFLYPASWRVEEALAPTGFSPNVLHIYSWHHDAEFVSQTDVGEIPENELKIDIVIIANPDEFSAGEFAVENTINLSDELTTVLSEETIHIDNADAIQVNRRHSDGTLSVVYVATYAHNAYIITAIPANSDLIQTFNLLLSTIELR
jgi:hypothetical protein